MSATCFERQSVHREEDLYIQFYSISFKHIYKQSGRSQDKTGCTSPPEDEHLDEHFVFNNFFPKIVSFIR